MLNLERTVLLLVRISPRQRDEIQYAVNKNTLEVWGSISWQRN